jgi:hypothetical protein
MAIQVSKHDLHTITTIMNSQPDGSGLSGYIDLETGAVELGSADEGIEVAHDA